MQRDEQNKSCKKKNPPQSEHAGKSFEGIRMETTHVVWSSEESNCLGQGSYGAVFLAERKIYLTHAAAKVYDCTDVFEHEENIWKKALIVDGCGLDPPLSASVRSKRSWYIPSHRYGVVRLRFASVALPLCACTGECNNHLSDRIGVEISPPKRVDHAFGRERTQYPLAKTCKESCLG